MQSTVLASKMELYKLLAATRVMPDIHRVTKSELFMIINSPAQFYLPSNHKIVYKKKISTNLNMRQIHQLYRFMVFTTHSMSSGFKGPLDLPFYATVFYNEWPHVYKNYFTQTGDVIRYNFTPKGVMQSFITARAKHKINKQLGEKISDLAVPDVAEKILEQERTNRDGVKIQEKLARNPRQLPLIRHERRKLISKMTDVYRQQVYIKRKKNRLLNRNRTIFNRIQIYCKEKAFTGLQETIDGFRSEYLLLQPENHLPLDVLGNEYKRYKEKGINIAFRNVVPKLASDLFNEHIIIGHKSVEKILTKPEEFKDNFFDYFNKQNTPIQQIAQITRFLRKEKGCTLLGNNNDNISLYNNVVTIVGILEMQNVPQYIKSMRSLILDQDSWKSPIKIELHRVFSALCYFYLRQSEQNSNMRQFFRILDKETIKEIFHFNIHQKMLQTETYKSTPTAQQIHLSFNCKYQTLHLMPEYWCDERPKTLDKLFSLKIIQSQNPYSESRVRLFCESEILRITSGADNIRQQLVKDFIQPIGTVKLMNITKTIVRINRSSKKNAIDYIKGTYSIIQSRIKSAVVIWGQESTKMLEGLLPPSDLAAILVEDQDIAKQYLELMIWLIGRTKQDMIYQSESSPKFRNSRLIVWKMLLKFFSNCKLISWDKQSFQFVLGHFLQQSRKSFDNQNTKEMIPYIVQFIFREFSEDAKRTRLCFDQAKSYLGDRCPLSVLICSIYEPNQTKFIFETSSDISNVHIYCLNTLGITTMIPNQDHEYDLLKDSMFFDKFPF